MSIQFESNEPAGYEAVTALLAEVGGLLKSSRMLGEMQQMSQEVGEAVDYQDYMAYLDYKKACLEELSRLNRTPGHNGALNSAIERGFILGYWFARQQCPVLDTNEQG